MTCRADRPEVSCPSRRLRVLQGRFTYRSGHGWVWLDGEAPEATWDGCPWCGGTLADLDQLRIDRATTMADGYRGEDGG